MAHGLFRAFLYRSSVCDVAQLNTERVLCARKSAQVGVMISCQEVSAYGACGEGGCFP